MRKLVLFILFFTMMAEIADAQIRRRSSFKRASGRIGQLAYTGGIGLTSYYGDLKESIPLYPRYSLSGGVLYRVHKHVNLRAELNYYQIAGDDQENDPESPIYDRGLNFRANNFEFGVHALGYVFDKYSRFNRSVVNPYVFAGIGFTTVAPKGEYQGDWVPLRPLATERDSRSSDPVYAPVALAVPFGAGVSVYALRAVDLSVEMGLRYTSTDYLDDVSTDYAEPFGTSLANSQVFAPDEIIAHTLADKRRVSNTEEGIKYRGNPTDNDWYMILSIKAVYTPGATSGGIRRKNIRRPKFMP
jgi:hypothetical protein